MRIELKHFDNFTEAEFSAFRMLEEKAFGGDDGEDQLEWIEKADWHVLIWEEELLAGHVEFSERTIAVNSNPIKVACIGGVCTDPSMRGKGLASALLKKAHEYIEINLGLEYAVLLTDFDLPTFYNKSGYTVIDSLCLMEQKVGKVEFNEVVMVFPFNNKPWPKGTIDLCGLPW